MRYILDTNICIYVIKKKPPEVIKTFEKFKPEELAVSSITVAELQYGVAKSAYPERNRTNLVSFLAPFKILSFTSRDAEAYGRIRAYLEKCGRVIGPLDMLIAAQAVSRQVPLVTNNEKEFKNIPHLTVSNWVKKNNP